MPHILYMWALDLHIVLRKWSIMNGELNERFLHTHTHVDVTVTAGNNNNSIIITIWRMNNANGNPLEIQTNLFSDHLLLIKSHMIKWAVIQRWRNFSNDWVRPSPFIYRLQLIYYECVIYIFCCRKKMFINNFFWEKWWILTHTRVRRLCLYTSRSFISGFYLYKCMCFTMNSRERPTTAAAAATLFIFTRSSACIPDFITICGNFYRFTRIVCKHMSRFRK